MFEIKYYVFSFFRFQYLVHSCYVFFLFQEIEKEKQKRDDEEMGDAMKSLENRTLDSKREMDILAGLDEMKSLKVSPEVYSSVILCFFSVLHCCGVYSVFSFLTVFLLFNLQLFQSRHATVSVDAMLEALQRSHESKV